MANITLPDHTEVSPSQTLVKTWQLKNTGATPWPVGTKLQYIRGDLPFESSFPVNLPEPGGLVEVSAVVRTPQTPGRFRSVFRLVDEAGKKFGPRLACIVVVQAPPLAVAVPTASVPPQPSQYAEQLAVLKSMNYNDEKTNQYLLEIHNGDLEAVVNMLLEQK